MKKQIVVIHGGDAHETYEDYLSFLENVRIDFDRYRLGGSDWKRTLRERLGERYEIIAPDMPDKINAKYAEWKIWFEKFIPHLEPETMLIGHSLGGTFLVKYLSENIFPRKLVALFLVAPCFDDTQEYSLGDFRHASDLSRLRDRAGALFLYYSEDDPIVPFDNLAKFRRVFPRAVVRSFRDRRHFNQEEFPELLDDIRSI